MRCQNSLDNNRRCKRTASKITIVKDGIEKQSKFWICDDCFNEKMYNIVQRSSNSSSGVENK
jgi:hypothetical protein